MIRDQIGLFADDEASMLADLAQLTPEPASLSSLLSGLGYGVQSLGTGLYAPGTLVRPASPALLFPLYHRAGLSVRNRRLVGRMISRSGTLAAGLYALRSLEHRPPLLFLREPQPLPGGMGPEQVVSLEGGVVPRIWRHCFGSFDVLARITGTRSHPGLPNTAINAIEAAMPVLQALFRLKADIQLRATRRGLNSDAPLQPRLTISAAHGGSRGSVLPTVFDLVVSRRYDPLENADAAFDEIEATILGATPRSLAAHVAITAHDRPVDDPDAANRTRQERALAAGWGWPQVAFCTSSTLVPGAAILGGLERPDCDPESDQSSTTFDEMSALARALRAFLLDS